MAETFRIVEHERCRCLTHKEMFYETERQPGEEAGRSGSELFWCAHTQTCLGPDGQMVDERNCVPGRACYEAV